MKTQNSTQWSNLYSNELNFNIKIYSSLLPRVLFILFVCLLAVLIISVLLFELNPVLTQLFVVCSITLLICVLNLFSSKLIRFIEKPSGFKNELIIYSDNSIELDKKRYLMHINSRVGLLGCWLSLTSEQGGQAKSKTLFIVKNSVSILNYSRLCRTIKRNTFNAYNTSVE